MDNFDEIFSVSRKKVDRKSKRIRDATKSKSKQERLDKWGGRNKWDKTGSSKQSGIKRSGSGKNLANLVLKELPPSPESAATALPKFLLPETDVDSLTSPLTPFVVSPEDPSLAWVSPPRTADGKILSTDCKVSLASLFRASLETNKGNLEMVEKLGKDEVVQTIFHALFKPKHLREDCNGEMKECLVIDEEDDNFEDVNEIGVKAFLNLTLFDDGLEGGTVPLAPMDQMGEEMVLDQYVDGKLVNQMVQELRHEDDRVPSMRLCAVKALYRAMVNRRGSVVVGLASAAQDRLQCCRQVEANARELGLDVEAMLGARTTTPVIYGASAPILSAPSRDHAMFLIELLDFVIATLQNETDSNEDCFESSFLQVGRSLSPLGSSDSEDFDSDSMASSSLISSSAEISKSQQLAYCVRALVAIAKCHASAVAGGSSEGELMALEGVVKRLTEGWASEGPSAEMMRQGGLLLVQLLLRSWPHGGNTVREVAFLSLLGTFLGSVPSLLMDSSSCSLVARIFSRMQGCISSLHFKVAQAALDICSNQYVISQYLLPCPGFLKAVSNALHSNKSHWNLSVRQRSEALFDSFLDFM
mmetsp:Transcript_30289/g.39950  ORF Transcript_30289/g.39950 Transcript_30289/m.39950 type:complete len:587 (+) Transcript_30289:298-2058(+)|eukprot:CAMPEP_0117752502 /NCGR_PEP_ID=MMETSP0947-20121206/11644_1 /TAXON_ID=44440 /ORGANISM="Chattonella subsalsa, Strain CCMP2191" /LENGTH=586 /DNA_ID=CAMNT_0005571157 /DNA_START=278 /DNA_END=2038 /DNA_ORIENTATION=-